MSDQRAEAATPHAAALVVAVADYDAETIARVLATVNDWQALAVVLAAMVPRSVGVTMRADMSTYGVATAILEETARRYRIHPDRICSADRHREVTDARAVAMAAMRYAGLTSVFIGSVVGRDHSTVLYAATRVGENPRMRRVAIEIATSTGPIAEVLGDEEAA